MKFSEKALQLIVRDVLDKPNDERSGTSKTPAAIRRGTPHPKQATVLPFRKDSSKA